MLRDRKGNLSALLKSKLGSDDRMFRLTAAPESACKFSHAHASCPRRRGRMMRMSALGGKVRLMNFVANRPSPVLARQIQNGLRDMAAGCRATFCVAMFCPVALFLFFFCTVPSCTPRISPLDLDSRTSATVRATSTWKIGDVPRQRTNFSVQGKGIKDNERFYAALIKVKLTAPKEIFAKGAQAEIVVTDRRTRKVVKRERLADVYIGGHGWTIHAGVGGGRRLRAV